MKKNVLFSLLMSALLLGGCAESVGTDQKQVDSGNAQGVNNGKIPVDFDAYQNRNVTRSGWAGVLGNDQLKATKANGGGFGVFAYYTDLKKYDQTYVPNFMYNQGVFWKGEDGNLTQEYWAYSPIMYWPNEYGFDAASNDEDHVTFFAYAPFTETVSHAAGSVEDATYGITGFSRNTATGDPMVKYIASFEPEKSVDLCWGVVPDDKTNWPTIQGGGSLTLAAGLPWLDLERPLATGTQPAAPSSSRIKFKFNHALAQLNVQIDTDADVTDHPESGDLDGELDEKTKVYVRSISFTGIALKGALNLNNTTKNQALWLDYSCTTDLAFGQSVTVHDGRRDSREGVQGAEAANETPTGLNPDIIQNATATPGVTHEYQNLFAPTSPIAVPGSPTLAELQARLEDAICVIPTGESMTITIVYDIEMEDPDLTSFLSDGKTHGLSIENKITKTVSFNNVPGAGLESNKRYALKLHLGMNSVKFEADVQDWATNTVNGEGWLPSNTRPITLNHTVMYLGAPQTLVATTNPLGEPVAWDNTDGSIASIPSAAPFTTRAGTRAPQSIALGVTNAVKVTPVAIGTTTVTGSLASGAKASCTVHVVPVTISSVRSSDSKAKGPNIAIQDTILVSQTATLTPVCFNATGIPPVDWTVSPTSGVVNISTDANQVCTVTATGSGTAVVTCTNTGYTSSPATYTIVVEQKTPTVTVPVLASGWTYDTTTKDLLTAGTVGAGEGTMEYSTDGTSWSTTVPTAKDAGIYTLYYRVTGALGYASVPSTPLGTVTVAKATPVITLSDASGVVRELGRKKTFTASISNAADGGTISVSSSDTGKATASLSSGTVTVKGVSTGTATITVSSAASTNYNAVSETYSVTVNSLDIGMNPLHYVADYNVNYDGGSTFSFSSALNEGYYFSFNDALKYFTTSSNYSAATPTALNGYNIGTGSVISGWHLPSEEEVKSISPSTYEVSLSTYHGTVQSFNVVFGWNATTKAGITENSYWFNSGSDVYAVRYIGTDYCSVWKYSFATPFTVSSTLIDMVDNSTDAATWIASNYASLTFTDSYSETRSFYPRGERRDAGSGAGGATITSEAVIQTSSECSSDASRNTYFVFGPSYMCFTAGAGGIKNWGVSVRLFRDN